MADTSAPRRPWLTYVLTGLVFAAAAYGVMALYQNIMLRKQEALQTAFELANLTEDTVDPKEWGKTFPRQYDSYLRTVDTQRTRYGGSENFQKLDDDPRLRTLFAGYANGTIEYVPTRAAYAEGGYEVTHACHVAPEAGEQIEEESIRLLRRIHDVT